MTYGYNTAPSAVGAAFGIFGDLLVDPAFVLLRKGEGRGLVLGRGETTD